MADPKYRVLSAEELQAFEKEFIDYMIVNGITGEDWEQLKAEKPAEAEEIVILFSDVILEAVLRKIAFMERRTKQEVQVFQCLPDKLVLVAMKAKDANADFTDAEFVKKSASLPPADLEIYTTSKDYSKTRELELFEMHQQGCEPTDGKLFKALCLALAENNTK